MKHYVNIGEVIWAEAGHSAWMVLGSCIAIVMYVPDLQIGTVCHAQLPGQLMKQAVRPHKLSGLNQYFLSRNSKHVAQAYADMLYFFDQRKIERQKIQVKLFGGASKHNIQHQGKTIGQQNIEVAKQLIKKDQLKLIYEDVAGVASRRLIIDFTNGNIEIRYLQN